MKNEPAIAIDAAARCVSRLKLSIGSIVHGKPEVIDLALTTLIAGGHLLLEDVPGVGKTTLAGTLAKAIGGTFSRIQFTADLLPSDVVGVNLLDGPGHFSFRAGPLFANVVLADEINRTTPKTQSALLEAMEEGRVTVDGETHVLPDPFVVIATQNPHDHHGTFPLPDSQLDRFFMRIAMGYPDRDAERAVLRRSHVRPELSAPAVSVEELYGLRRVATTLSVPLLVEDYLLDLVRASREASFLVRGVSTRGAQALYGAARAYALVRGRSFVIPEDVRDLAIPVLAHRVIARVDGPGGDGGRRAVERLLEGIGAPATW